MSQQNITLFFPRTSYTESESTRQKKLKGCSFLALPLSVRHRIYEAAGVPVARAVHMNLWSSLRERRGTFGFYSWPLDGDDEGPPELMIALFSVCKLVHGEISKILYGSNRLIVTHHAPRGLRILERLTDTSLQNLRFIIIRLRVASCDNKCCTTQSGGFRGSPLNRAIPSHQQDISQWERICRRFAVLIPPGKLKLYLICDCADLVTAETIVKSLLHLPLLQDCALRLGIIRNDAVQVLAKRTVFRLLDRAEPPPVPHFKFLDLPKEIQIHVLRFAGLRMDFSIQGSHLIRISCKYRGMVYRTHKHREEDLFGCFCEKSHSSYNTFCQCSKEGFNVSYMAVSQNFREMAMRIFFGGNKITVYSNSPWHRCDASINCLPRLCGLPEGSIRWLTHLTLNFGYQTVNCVRVDVDGEITRFWRERIVGVLATEVLNRGGLHLELRFSEGFYPSFEYVSSAPDYLQEEEKEGYEETMLPVYEELVREVVTKLQGLKRFFVHMNWDTSWEDSRQLAWNKDGGKRYKDGRGDVEERLERLVMGDGYDAWKEGKQVRDDFNPENWY